MKRTLAFLTHPQRYMRGRGFGVHSPFAFNFIRDVVGETRHCRYYAYKRLEQLAKENRGIDASTLKLIFRIACRMQPATFKCSGQWGVAAAKCIKLAVPSAKESTQPTADMWIVSRGADTMPPLDEEAVVVAVDCQAATDMLAATDLEYGMVFRKGKLAVGVLREHLPRQNFDIV